MNRSLVFPLLVLGLAACSDSTGLSDVAVIPTKGLYVTGEIPSAQIVNRSEHNISFNRNGLRVEKLQGTVWLLIGPEDLPDLLPLGLVIGAGGTSALRVVPEVALEPGTYRLRFGFTQWGKGDADTSYSPEFRVDERA
jgi:hypothetical protein